MLKRYRFWLWTAVVLLFTTAIIHSLTLFFTPEPQNETERQLIGLMTTYKTDFGAGFVRSTNDLVTALSACFSLVCLLGGSTLAYLARRSGDLVILKGVIGIHIVVFGICFLLMAVFTFLPPIVLTGLIFLTLLTTFFLIGKTATVTSTR